jgi:archaemetzincin
MLALSSLLAACQPGESSRAEPHLAPNPPITVTHDRQAELGALAARLATLHQRKVAPGPSDWLAHHAEAGQTFREWRDQDPVLPDLETGPNHRHWLYVQPLGALPGARARIVRLASEYLELFFGLPVRTRHSLPLSLVPPEARRIHPTQRSPQILSGFVLDRLLAPRLPEDAAAYISFTAADLWPGEGWNFVFGQASLRDRVGVWSVARYGDPDAGEAAFREVLARTLKVAVHETGHMFSMRHCTAYECVMNGVNNQDESDRSPLWLCPECLAKVLLATGQDATTRYERLAAFAQAQGLEREAAMFRASAELAH